ncbi:MAG: TDP-N-acetylfucosamine:lipid II N-acetylfucosaminyltransferase [Paludibacter sp.]|nr:TDP-N-acetylfucosamine:lipid II N-acetylfucosaminyltransferase [Paludibacter sp.]
MYYHFFTGENGYSKALLDQIEEITDLKQHFVVFGFARKQDKSLQYSEKLNDRIKYLTKVRDLLFVLKNIKKAHWIYLHFLAYDPSLLFWALNKKLIAKSTWIIWGSDLYSYYKRNKNLKTRIYEILRKKIIGHLPEIAAFVKEDYDLVKKLYYTNAVYTPILYPIPVNTKQLDKFRTNKASATTTFLTGNSGDPSNLHIEMLNYLSRFSNEDIIIKCPLSYGGSAQYIEKVIQYGNEIFAEKFEPVTNYMNTEEYAELLSTVDVALMNHKRQQGLGNILALMYLGRKVYMRSDITSYYFFERHKCDIFDIRNIDKSSFGELIKPVDKAENNFNTISKIISKEYYLNLWDDLLKKHAK